MAPVTLKDRNAFAAISAATFNANKVPASSVNVKVLTDKASWEHFKLEVEEHGDIRTQRLMQRGNKADVVSAFQSLNDRLMDKHTDHCKSLCVEYIKEVKSFDEELRTDYSELLGIMGDISKAKRAASAAATKAFRQEVINEAYSLAGDNEDLAESIINLMTKVETKMKQAGYNQIEE